VTLKDRDVVRVCDLPIAGRLRYLLWRKRRYRCEACERCRAGNAHAEVARAEHATRYRVMRAFEVGADQLQAARERRPPRRLSLDEAAHRRRGELATVVWDLDRRRVIEVLDGRSRQVVERYLQELPDSDRRSIEVVSIDPYEAYRQAIRAQLPGARIVVDHFHLVRGANTALDAVRRERQRQRHTRRPKGARRSGQHVSWRPDLFHSRHRLLRAREKLTARQRRQPCELFAHEPLLAEAWGLKEAFRFIYQAPDHDEAQRRLDAFLAAADRAQIPSFAAFAQGRRQWREELLAHFEQPTTNGYGEGVINKVKVIKRRAYGLPTLQGYRKRVVIACG
jgi:transposase